MGEKQLVCFFGAMGILIIMLYMVFSFCVFRNDGELEQNSYPDTYSYVADVEESEWFIER